MDEKLQQEIFSRLDAVAAKLGVAADQLWEILIKQAFIEGITSLIWAVILIGAAIIGWWGVCSKRFTWTSFDQEAPGPKFLFILAGLGCTIAAPFALTSAIQYLLNPEYQAFQNLLTIIR